MTKILPKRSDTSGNSPTLVDGEFAIHRADKRILVANSTVTFDAFQNTVSNIAISNSTGIFAVGNSTVNVIANSTSITLANSTVSFVLTTPTAAQVTAGNYFLGANNLWQQVTGGSGGVGGSNTDLQFNDSGSANGVNNFTFDKSTNTVTLNGAFSANADFISVGNSTVNTVINSTSIHLGGSIVAANGYTTLPNGLIFQWGSVSANATTLGNVTFSIPFPTAVYSITATSITASANVYANNANTSTVAIRSSTAAIVYYMAIGK